LNHIALEVGDVEEALAFYGRLFRFELRGKSDTMAFIDLGDQLATNSSLYRKGVGSLRMTAAILVWWSMIRMRHDALLEMPASRH
jgi:catechol 2,3-dioxygenase-like lactoylglutathione lyase family enzyme